MIKRILALADGLDREAEAQSETIALLGGPIKANAYHVGARDAHRLGAHRVRNLGSALKLRRG